MGPKNGLKIDNVLKSIDKRLNSIENKLNKIEKSSKSPKNVILSITLALGFVILSIAFSVYLQIENFSTIVLRSTYISYFIVGFSLIIFSIWLVMKKENE